MPFVLDASVALAWLFEDEASEYADIVLEHVAKGPAVVPSIWPLEVANGLAVGERRGRLTDAQVVRAAELTLELPISVRDMLPTTALGSVLELARSLGLSAYDASYLDLARREGLPLATSDERVRAAAERLGIDVVTR